MVINDVTEFVRNGASIKQEKGCGGIPITRIETIANSKFNYDRLGYANIYDDKYQDYYLKNDDVLLSHINSEKYLGRAVVYKQDTDKRIIHGMNLLCLRFISSRYNPAYFCYYAQSDRAKMYISKNTKKSVNQASITATAIKNMPIPESSVEEQNNVVFRLDSVQSIIDLYYEQLKRLDELIKSRFVEMFGDMIINPCEWNRNKLGKVCDVRDGTHDSPSYYDEGYPLVTSKNVTNGTINFSNCNCICEADFNKINERSKVDIGDILMPMIGTIGKPVIVKTDKPFAIKNVALIKFYPNSLVNNTYIHTILKSDYFDRMVISKIRGGTQRFIALGDIRELTISIPPIEFQNQFADFVTQVEKQKATVQHSIDKLETLKKSLMQEYFG